MKILFHGDDQAGSRKKLIETIEKEKNLGNEIRTVDGAKTTHPELESVLTTASLFGAETIVIEGLFSRPLGNERKRLLELIKNYDGPKHLLFWDKKEITKTVINAASSKKDPVQAVVAKTPSIIFTFLDSVAPGKCQRSLELMHQAARQVDEGFVFIMLVRHIADLMIAKSGDTSKLIPFKRSHLISQANGFTDAQLRDLHSALVSIDRSIKTGTSKQSYLEQLDVTLVISLN